MVKKGKQRLRLKARNKALAVSSRESGLHWLSQNKDIFDSLAERWIVLEKDELNLYH